jgi:hypothetical protein
MRVIGCYIDPPDLFTGYICPTLGQIAHFICAQLISVVFLLKKWSNLNTANNTVEDDMYIHRVFWHSICLS